MRPAMTWTLIAALLAADGGYEADAGVTYPPPAPGAPAPAPAPAPAQPQVIYVPVPQQQAPPPAPAPEKEPEERVRHFFVSLEAGAGYINLASVAADGTVVGSRNNGIFGGLNFGIHFLHFL